MSKLTLQALAISLALGMTSVYAQSTGSSSTAGKPSSGSVGSGQAADKAGTGAAASETKDSPTARGESAGMKDNDRTTAKSKSSDGPKGTGATPSSGAVGSGEAAPISGQGPGAGMGGGTGARTGMETQPK